MEEIMKSCEHKRDSRGNVVLDYKDEEFFDYIQGDVTKLFREKLQFSSDDSLNILPRRF